MLPRLRLISNLQRQTIWTSRPEQHIISKANIWGIRKPKVSLRPQKNPVMPHSISPRKEIAFNSKLPLYALDSTKLDFWADMSTRPLQIQKKFEDIDAMKKSCKLARKVLDFAGSLVKPGVTTDEIDQQAHEMIIKNGAYPSPLGYGPSDNVYNKSICTSINEVICHGIPDSRKLEEGDIINIDVTVYLSGFHGDCSATFEVGKVDENAKKLIKATEEALNLAIQVVRPNTPISKIGQVIEDYATKQGFYVPPDLVGHGVGRLFHGRPPVPHVANDSEEMMIPGMTFTIEPVLVEAEPHLIMWEDGWTISDAHGAWSAQFEHTVLVTQKGVEVLTKKE